MTRRGNIIIGFLLRKTSLSWKLFGPPKDPKSIKERAYLLNKEIEKPTTFVFEKFEAPSRFINRIRSYKKYLEEFSDSRKISYPFSAGGVAILPNAAVGSGGNVIVSEGDLLKETLSGIRWLSEARVMRRLKIFSKGDQRGVKAAALTSFDPDCYYHWMFETVPKFLLLQESELRWEKIYIEKPKRAYQQETLSLFGIQEEQIIFAEWKSFHLFDQLIVPYVPSSFGTIAPWVFKRVRQAFLPEENRRQQKKRLFISREDAPKRRLLNEEEIYEVSSKYGFEKILLTKMSLKEQALLFQSADCIMAPHGAGLTNLVFSQPGTKVIEIFQPEHVDVCFYRMAQECYFEHHSLFGNPSEDKKTQSFTLQKEKATQLLKELFFR